MSPLRWRSSVRARRGSVLVPTVAAMLILSLCGGALANLFGAQRIQSVLVVESAQAYWLAEAGAWHAASEGAAIATSTTLGNGGYTVARSGDTYSSTGVLGRARRTFSKDYVPGVGGPGGTPPTDPLDNGASVASAGRNGRTRIDIDLVSQNSYPHVIASFALTANRSTAAVERARLDRVDIWRRNGGVGLPTGDLALNEGFPENYMVAPGESPTLRLEFASRPSGTIYYTLLLRYTNGASSTLVFPIGW